jgi:hypothetical protein
LLPKIKQPSPETSRNLLSLSELPTVAAGNQAVVAGTCRKLPEAVGNLQKLPETLRTCQKHARICRNSTSSRRKASRNLAEPTGNLK